jgi:hypothetical protein
MAVQKYDVQRPALERGAFEERYWSPVNTPILNDNDEMQYIIHRVEDLTEFVRVQRRERSRAKSPKRSVRMRRSWMRRCSCGRRNLKQRTVGSRAPTTN